MIISCPACATRYVLPDSAIGPEGRTVRCAKCKHSWYQDGPEMAEPIAAAYAPSPSEDASGRPEAIDPPPPPPVAAPRPPVRDPAPITDPQAEGVAPTAVDEEPAPVEGPAPTARSRERDAFDSGDDEVSQFDHAPPFRPRRNWLKALTWGAGAFAVLAIAAVVAMTTLGTPSWLPVEKPLYGADPGLTVEFPPEEQETRTLPNGAEFFGARVIVKNDTRETKAVPPLLIVLRDSRDRVVYSWEVNPPQRSLAPGESMTINEAVTDVPKSAHFADIGWAPR
ncbi:zinc-ribbon domain-containing protein [Qipengyuania sp.]|uniref:zinc-ribbon domain-containing protein n=1 Tax=Qipengyuania sp. TaxID=2004515 RepID=UPI0035C843F4